MRCFIKLCVMRAGNSITCTHNMKTIRRTEAQHKFALTRDEFYEEKKNKRSWNQKMSVAGASFLFFCILWDSRDVLLSTDANKLFINQTYTHLLSMLLCVRCKRKKNKTNTSTLCTCRSTGIDFHFLKKMVNGLSTCWKCFEKQDCVFFCWSCMVHSQWVHFVVVVWLTTRPKARRKAKRTKLHSMKILQTYTHFFLISLSLLSCVLTQFGRAFIIAFDKVSSLNGTLNDAMNTGMEKWKRITCLRKPYELRTLLNSLCQHTKQIPSWWCWPFFTISM